MKKTYFLIHILVFFSVISYGQINYEGTVDSRVNTIQLSDGITRYYTYDSNKKTLKIYNLDNHIWKNIKLQIPENEMLDEIKLVTYDLFNSDGNVEVVYTTLKWDFEEEHFEAVEGSFLKPKHTLFILKDTSEVLLEVKDGYEIRIIKQEGNDKLLVFKKKAEGDFFEKQYTDVYSLNN